MAVAVCPWERHFTPISSLYPGGNEYLTSVGGGKRVVEGEGWAPPSYTTPRHSESKLTAPMVLIDYGTLAFALPLQCDHWHWRASRSSYTQCVSGH